MKPIIASLDSVGVNEDVIKCGNEICELVA